MDNIDEGGARSVIVAEDDATNRWVLCRMLTKMGYDIKRAVDGEQAVAAALREDARIVFMDLNMPGLSGYEAAGRIKATPGLHGVRVVAVTGDVTERARRDCETAGFDGFLAKPVRKTELQAELDRALAAG